MKEKTLLESILSGDIPDFVREVASRERIPLDQLLDHLIAGRAVITSNRWVRKERPCAVGTGLRTKVNANIGTSLDYADPRDEIVKLRVAVEAGTDAVMDLSTGGNLDQVRELIVRNSPVSVGSVPIYQAAAYAREVRGSIVEMTSEDIFRAIEAHCSSGVDFITVHCGVTMRVLEVLQKNPRVADIVSRGGSFHAGWILHHEEENPLYADFDRLLGIARTYDVTLSLGDGLRPGALADATDAAQVAELLVLGELVLRAREAGVQCMVEGPGHIPLHQVETNVQLAKALAHQAPFYVLGPLVTDVAPGHDHIVAAIGGALAGRAGADFLCYVTPREHLGLPTPEDVREGVMVMRIAAHAADIARGVPGALDWDLEMSRARKALDWEKQMKLALDPQRARELFEERQVEGERACTMCGEFCAMEFISRYLGRKLPPC
jgi:phosphomethylpyrimidine synthase